MASLDTLSDSEIRVRLTEYGYPVGPVTATTRKVMLKKLKSLMESGDGNRRQEPPSGSGEESDGGVSRGGLRSRRSMPPPKSPPRRKSPARARDPDVPLANSTALDDPPASTSFEETTSSTTRSRSPYVPSYAPMTSRFGLSEGFRSRLQSGDDFGTTLSSPSPLPSASISSVSPSPSYHPNQPYSSDLARRLSSLHSSRLSMVGSSVGKTMEARTDHIEHGGRQSIGGISSPISSKFLDVKESDDEDNGSVQGYAKFGQSGKGAAVMQARSSGRVAQDGWFSYDSPVSALLLVVFLLFFLAIGATYINMHSVENAIAPGKSLSYIPCPAKNVPSNTDCIVDTDFPLAETVFWIVHDEFMERAAKMGCYELGDAGQLSDTEVANLVVAKNNTLDATDVQRSIPSVKVLVKANSNFRLFVTPSNAIALDDVPTTFTCYVIRKLVFAANWLMKLSIMTAALAFGYKGVSWWVSKNARYKEDVYRLVTNIVEIVSTKAQESPGGGYVPISHVRDQLIPPQDRQRLAKLWNDAVTMLESDSRLRSEVQLVEGEEFLVWRWLASPLAVNKRKVWQGQAFETVEGSVNSLPDSPTSCLKIRHMFDPAFEEGEDWVTTVADAILDKCGDARILHIVVDKLSREGCVYMKCASQRDAGIAYRALHGSWFDSKLVTVKYIREKRYLERFPDSAKSVLPLQPSNDKKNSLQ